MLRRTAIRHIGIGTFLLVCAFSLSEAKAQELSVPISQDIAKTLSLRIKPRTITYERPTAGNPLKINNGATVLVQNKTIQSVISMPKSNEPIKLTPNVPLSDYVEKKQKPIPPIEMRVLGQTIYLDRLVELLVVQDITGRSIRTLVGSNKMSLDDLGKGVYIVRVQDKGLTHTSKFILR